VPRKTVGTHVPRENRCHGKTYARGKHVPVEYMCHGKICHGETCAGRSMCHGEPWEHMCLGKTGAMGKTYAVGTHVP